MKVELHQSHCTASVKLQKVRSKQMNIQNMFVQSSERDSAPSDVFKIFFLAYLHHKKKYFVLRTINETDVFRECCL